MSSSDHITFILNPVAGRGKAQHILSALNSSLQNFSTNHTLLITTHPGEAIQLAQDAARQSSIVVAVGGDGTVNEVAAGLAGTESALGVISVGSGNDFARTVEATDDVRQMLQRFSNPSIKKFDVGKVRLTHIHGKKEERLFFNSLGIGFDAAVAKKVSSIRWMKGIPLYMAALLRTLAGYKPHFLEIESSGQTWKRNYFLLCCGLGKWEGGGFELTPDAIPGDGKFQVCGITGHTIAKVLPVLPSIMTGSHKGKKCVELFDATMMKITSHLPVPVHGDGEIFGTSILECDISILPSQLNVIGK